jgi:pimeloyl-ACP methyl ester carboxylesterase
VDLETHIRDVCAVIETEELRDVVVLGHSYGGMVATGVADRLRERVARVIYLDAFVPRDGESLFDLLPPEDRAAKETAAQRDGQGWLVPPNPVPPDTAEEDRRWLEAHRRWQPIETLRQPIRLTAEPACPRDYVYALRKPPADPFGRFAARARDEARWTCREIDASHSPNVTAPGSLMETIGAVLGR